MKKFFTLAIALVCACSAFAQDENGCLYPADGMIYKVLDAEAHTVTLYGRTKEFTGGDVQLPATFEAKDNMDVVQTWTLVAIQQFAVKDAEPDELITSLVIPATVQKFSTNWQGLKNLRKVKKITFAEGSKLSALAKGCFQNCYALEEINLPATITEIPNYTFQTCSNLEKLDIPANVNAIGTGAFNADTSLEALYFHGETAPVFAQQVFSVEALEIHTVAGAKATYQAALADYEDAIELDYYEDVVNGIRNIVAEDANNAIYNIAGQRVANGAKGVQIVNGKKVVK